jgi:predicted esterase YcpF (UPF0227 family)
MKIRKLNNNKTVVVYHGFGGSPSSIPKAKPNMFFRATDRVEYLDSIGYNVIYPHIDYEMEWSKDRCLSLFKKQLIITKNSDIIIGISLGGYIAFELSGYLSKDVILINPAIDRTKTKLNIKEFDIDRISNYGKIEVFFGENDNVIENSITIDYLNRKSINFDYSIIKNMEHRVPIDKFKDIINKSKLL